MERKIVAWNEKLGHKECPYARRWVLNFGLFAIRVHHWIKGDDADDMHDHPYWFITWVIKGSYVDQTPDGTEFMSRWRLRFRRARHIHKVILPVWIESKEPVECWTLLITGPPLRQWGFWVNGRWQRAANYFKKNGHHPCQD